MYELESLPFKHDTDSSPSASSTNVILRNSAMSIQSNDEVLAIGELLWDVLPSGKLLGGAPANYSYRLRQLGVPARMISRVGNDALGDELLGQLTAKDFDLSLIQRDSSLPTGTVDVTLTADGSPHFVINTGVAYDNIEVTPDLLEAAKRARFIYFGTLSQRSPKTRETLYTILSAATNATKFLDINLRGNCYSKETLTSSLHHCDILKLNDSEVVVLSDLLELGATTPDELASVMIKDFSVSIVLVTLGEKGVYAVSKSGESISVPGISVTVVDTIGAGDAFSAGFTFKYLQGAPLKECCRFGNITGAMNAARAGGMPNILTKEIEDFIASRDATLAVAS
jgi:fructokinase